MVISTPTTLDIKDELDGSLSCILCQENLGFSIEIVRLHFLRAHGVELPSSRRVRNVSGMLDFLQRRILSPGGEASSTGSAMSVLWRCPVCQQGQGCDLNSLELHLAAAQHQRWNKHSVEGLGAFYLQEIMSSDTDSDKSGTCESFVSEKEGDWMDQLPMVCLYCPYKGADCLEHMIEAHQFDLKQETRNRRDIEDEYDLVRLVNSIRRAVGSGKCPYLSVCPEPPRLPSTIVTSENESLPETCDEDVSKNGLESHWMEHPSHRTPMRLVRSDEDLIPVLEGDALISFMMASEEGFLNTETEDPDFPMVPTILQLAERQRAEKNRKGVSERGKK